MNGNRRGRAAATVVTASLVALLVLSGLGPASAGGGEDPVARGRFLFRVYCINCHGETGKGDGPVAGALQDRPADLTRISHRNGGRFPSSEVYDKIAGLGTVPGHRKNEMPLWGFVFQQFDQDSNQEEELRRTIMQLVKFLRTIQKNDDISSDGLRQ